MSVLKERKTELQSQGGAEIGSRLGKGSKQLNSEKKKKKYSKKQPNKINTEF